MAGMLSAGGGYRRTVLAVAVTGTVCAGVGLVVYAGLKKLKEKKSLSGRGVEATNDKASIESQVPAKSPEATKGATEIAEKPKVEVAPRPSMKDAAPAKPKSQIEKPSQSQAESKPAQPSQPPTPPQAGVSPPSKPPAPSQATAAQPSKPPAPSLAAAAQPPKPPAPSQAAASPPKAPTQPEPPKPTASEKAPPPQPKVEAPVAEKSEAVKVSTVSDPFQFAKVESSAAPDVKVKEVAKVPSKEKVPAAIDNVVASTKATVRETLDSATTKASGDGPDSLSLSSIDSKLDSDIVVIDDVKAASIDIGRVSEGSGDVIGAPIAPVVGVPLPEMLTPPEMPSMGALSSISDDIEIIQDSPPSTDTTDSGDFVKCERNVDLSQSIEILKEPKSEDKLEEVQGKIEQPSTTEETKLTGPVSTGSVGDDNANFQPPSLKAEEKDQPPIEQKPQEKH